MKKTFVRVLFLFLLLGAAGLFLLFSFPIGAGMGDWSYPLPNNYEMWRIHSQSIVVGLKRTENSLTIYDHTNQELVLIGIPKHIIAFAVHGHYVLGQTIAPEDTEDFYQGKDTTVRYYILDTSSQKTMGPYEREYDYLEALKALALETPPEWKKTRPAPRGAVF